MASGGRAGSGARLLSRALAALLPLLFVAPTAHAAEPDGDRVDTDAIERLREGVIAFYRGEYTAAAALFESILERPVRLRSAADLHQGFLHWGWTLYLQGDVDGAPRCIEQALRLDPSYRPSPATTRPDLLGFYESERDAFLAKHPDWVSPTPEMLFPELRRGDSYAAVRTRRFVPAFGEALRQYGRPDAGNALLAIEVSSIGLNVAGLAVWIATAYDVTPPGYKLLSFSNVLTTVGAAGLWTALAVDIVASLDLRARTRRGQLDPPRPRAAKPQVRPAGLGVAVRF